jgi:hypothetical protein
VRRVVLATVLIAALSLPAAAFAGDELTHLSGTWVLAEQEDSIRARIDRAIEGAMDQMEGVYAAFRWVARPQLRKFAKVCERYELEVNGDHFTWRCDDDGAQERVIGKGSGPVIGEDGNIYDVKIAATSAGVRMLSEGAAGGERAVFAQADDSNLLVSKAMFSPHMPDEVAWTMRYRRIE